MGEIGIIPHHVIFGTERVLKIQLPFSQGLILSRTIKKYWDYLFLQFLLIGVPSSDLMFDEVMSWGRGRWTSWCGERWGLSLVWLGWVAIVEGLGFLFRLAQVDSEGTFSWLDTGQGSQPHCCHQFCTIGFKWSWQD